MAYIEPISISLNVSGDAPDDDDSDGDDGMLPMQYIPILKTLKALLSQEDVIAQVLEDRRSKDGVIRDFCDGDVFGESPLFQQHPNALQVMLYNDEFSCTNPLRNRSKNHKIYAVYFVLGNLSPMYRSALNSIQLVSLCPQPLLKKYGFAKMLQPLINDLKLLETEGIQVCVDGSNYHFYGTVSFVAADNLAAHGLGRFFENFSSALRLCRFCNATKESMALSFDENRFILRTSSSYDAQVKLVCQNKVLVSTYGVKHPFPLNQLAFFHVCNGLPADIAHDLFKLAYLKELTEDLHTSFCSLSLGTMLNPRGTSPSIDKKIWTPSSLLDDEQQALHLECHNYLNANIIDSTFVGDISLHKRPEQVQDLISSHLGIVPENVVKAEKIVQCGSTFAVGTVAILGFEDDDYRFGEIAFIFLLQSLYFLCCKKLDTLEYNVHFQAHILKDTDTWVLIQPSQLLDHQVLGLYSVNNEKAVVMKYHVNPTSLLARLS
ncbi:hypothetical protein CAPTEDRAFT_213746 [Capitella teleta]|uniref:Uncharacterized protein n=1 Tax=Capitella teleta TaxID=283909 RepID=R7TIY4_CAPTE|nr:hypothetical protein CAPTEDRAFT_213746 [Capitella teleta]|eukprot:ELT93442.1 hypothetical protein CAPTEDRAFT_213746 [Capitella teleta]